MKKTIKTLLTISTLFVTSNVLAGYGNHHPSCAGLPSHEQLEDALKKARAKQNGGLDLDMWATVVNRDGFVCAVAYTGQDRNSQWPGSRIISAQKAYTANAFSLDGLVLSTANLYSATQPGGSLYGLQHSNPIATDRAYHGNPLRYGSDSDPMDGKKVGGINVFGGGLGLYVNSKIIGAIGVSGDTSCADHNIAWRARDTLGLDQIVQGQTNGVGTPGDNIVFDINNKGVSLKGFGHPACAPNSASVNADVISEAPLN